jgi:hypothetical protein
MSSSASITFRTLGGAHTINKLPNETDEQAIGRQLNEHPHRIKIEMLDGSPFVVVLELEHPIVVQRNRECELARLAELEAQRNRERDAVVQRERQITRQAEMDKAERESVRSYLQHLKKPEVRKWIVDMDSCGLICPFIDKAVRLQMRDEERIMRDIKRQLSYFKH